jgi:uncharacterized protein (DUF1330 family)
MSAYIIVDVEITDPKRYAEYIQVVPATIARYGGKFLVRGGRAETLEGSWDPKRIVVLEFASFSRAMEWWASEEYKAPKALRQSASVANMIVVQGVE